MEKALPAIPSKRYFTIGEVGDLCGVKPHVLRYWEQEFTQLRPMKRRGNRRYYQHHEVLMIRRIRDLLYDQGFTISGARNKMQEILQTERDRRRNGEQLLDGLVDFEANESDFADSEFGAVSEGIDGPGLEPATSTGQQTHPRTVNGRGIGQAGFADSEFVVVDTSLVAWQQLRRELHEIRELLGVQS